MRRSTKEYVCLALTLMSLAYVSVRANEGPVSNPSDGYINFSFDQVDIRSFVKLVGDITGRRFVVADDVQGKFTVVSRRVSRREVYPLFVSILESSGCSVIQDKEIYRIVALPKRVIPVAPVVGVDEQTPEEGMVTKIIRLEHVSAIELRKVLESKVGGGKTGAIGAIDETNHLIITDTADSIRQIEKIVAEIDRPGLARMTEVVSLDFAGAEDIATQLNLAMAESESRGEKLRRRLPAVPGRRTPFRRTAMAVASPHSNSLILVGTLSQISELKRMIKKMDVDAPSGRGRLNVIFLKYMSAEEAAKSLSALLAKSSDKDTGQPRKRNIAIEAIAANNALLVDASLGDFDVVKKLVEQLDQIPQQVHISVIIAEHSLSDDLNFGVEMAVLEMPSKVGSTVIQGSSRISEGADSLMNRIQQGIFPRGITVGVIHGSSLGSDGRIVSSFPGILNIDAIIKTGKFRIRSETSLEAQNNKEASINIVNEIPILKSTIQGGSGTARDIIQNIERVDVGIKLKLTPHIIPGGEVQMTLNTSIEAVIDPGPSDTLFTPTIAKREVMTTVIVPDGQMIVIAGLTREDKTQIIKKFPILGSIPLLGLLFRHKIDTTEKTNLLIFVTPRIVSEAFSTAESIREEWENKTGLKAHEEQL